MLPRRRRPRLAQVASVALVASMLVALTSAPPAFAVTCPNPANGYCWGGYEGTTTYRGIDGYLRQSGTVSVPYPAHHLVWINLCSVGCSEFAQTGTYQGYLPFSSSPTAVHVYYENVTPCGDYREADKGAPGAANYPYYISHDGGGTVTVGCDNGSHRTGYGFLYRKGSFGSNSFFTGYMSSNYELPFVKTEIYNDPPYVNADYFGCQDVGSCTNAGYGIHVYTAASTWVGFTGPASKIHYDPPYVYSYETYWSFRTCPTSC
jgi:hypothetical protein